MRTTSQKILLLSVILVLLGTILIPLHVQGAGLVPCGSSELKRDSDNNIILTTIPEDNIIPAGFKKIDDNYMAEYLEPRCGFCHIFQLGHNIVTFFLLPSESINNNIPVVPLMATLLFAVGGVYLLSGAGSPELHEKGKKTLTSVVIGLLIVYAAWVFVNTFLMFLGVAEWTNLGSWWQIQCGG